MIHVLWILFGWPNGIVLGNLLASVIWAGPALLHIHLRLRRIHRAIAPEDAWS